MSPLAIQRFPIALHTTILAQQRRLNDAVTYQSRDLPYALAFRHDIEMHTRAWLNLVFGTAVLSALASANKLSYRSDIYPRQVTIFDDRPDDCPPCFNCNLDSFPCMQFGNCTASSGQCACPTGFGGIDCSSPLCGSPVDETTRKPRPADQKDCKCDKGWDGLVCNVCQTNDACNALMPEGKDGVCYKQGLVQKENHQMCDVTNKKIIDALDPEKPQVTFACNRERNDCNFQCKHHLRPHVQILV